jgi:hypothetical protein
MLFVTLGAVSVIGAFASASVASAAGQFPVLQSGFTQELYGTAGGFFGGVAFAPNADVWVDFCENSGSPLDRFDNSTTILEHGSKVHPLVTGSPFASNAGCGLTNHPNGALYSNIDDGTHGVAKVNASTAAALETLGPPGNALGITVDPQTNHLVYVARDCRLTVTCTILSLDPTTGTSTTFATLSSTDAAFVDGIAFDPTGNSLFLSNRAPTFRLTVLNRGGGIVQHIPMTSEPDGIAFHATAPQFVVTSDTDGTITRFDFPSNDFTKTPTQSTFAAGGFRGDLTQVGADGCMYVTQDEGTRYDDGTLTTDSSIVRICGGFAPPPGVSKHPTSTSVKCEPQPVVAGQSTTCTATVTDTATSGATTPTGTVSFTTGGPGSFSKASCKLTTVSSSSASCSVTYIPTSTPAEPVRSDTITAKYGGDGEHEESEGTTTVTVISPAALAHGSFVIGDENATIGKIVTFSDVEWWGSEWWKLNSLSGGPAPSAFKGFAQSSPSPPTCNETWTTNTGNNSGPPATVPEYMEVIGASKITQSGSKIKGNAPKLAVVKTNPGYMPNPGHKGTGIVVAVVNCS